MSFTNYVVFAGDTGGNLVALSAHTGYKFWTFATGVTVSSSPAIFNNTVYWGVGGASSGSVPGHTLYAFAVPAD
jgi:outer membrane protein assembly factor BamB